MPATLPTQARFDTITQMIGTGWFNSLKIRLLGTNLTIGSATTLAQCIAAEATFAGYAPGPISIPSPPASDITGAIFTTFFGQFTPTALAGSGSIYGYFLCDSTETLFLLGETYASGPVSVPQGETYTVDLQYEVFTEF